MKVKPRSVGKIRWVRFDFQNRILTYDLCAVAVTRKAPLNSEKYFTYVENNVTKDVCSAAGETTPGFHAQIWFELK